MAVKLNSSDQVVTINTIDGLKVVGNLCCPIGSMLLIDETCCECTYSFNLTGTIAAGCGDSTYFPNRCQPTSYQTAAITIGPFNYDVEIISNSITVDDELIVNGQIFQPGLYPVEPSGQCPDGLCPGGTGFGTSPNCVQFAGGESTCNGQHTIPVGTVITVLSAGTTATIAAGDNHGIQLFANGQIKIKPIAFP
jgi:hypothetical protein